MVSKFERIIQMTPAYDRREKNGGIGSVGLFMTLKGEFGAVTFHTCTGWHPPHVAEEHSRRIIYSPLELKILFLPGPAEIATHSPRPTYLRHEPSDGVCPYIEGGQCYIGYSVADPVLNALLLLGSEGVWPLLEEMYERKFMEQEASNVV